MHWTKSLGVELSPMLWKAIQDGTIECTGPASPRHWQACQDWTSELFTRIQGLARFSQATVDLPDKHEMAEAIEEAYDDLGKFFIEHGKEILGRKRIGDTDARTKRHNPR